MINSTQRHRRSEVFKNPSVSAYGRDDQKMRELNDLGLPNEGFTKIRSQVRSSTSSSFLQHDDRSSVPSKSSSARSSSLPSVTSIFSRSSSFYTPPSQQRYEAATEREQHTKPLEEYNTPEIRRLADGKFSIKVKLALVGLKLYAWLQRKAGWDEVDPPVQVYKNGKLLKPEDWSPELKEKYGYSVI